jgi:hypothetical protein
MRKIITVCLVLLFVAAAPGLARAQAGCPAFVSASQCAAAVPAMALRKSTLTIKVGPKAKPGSYPITIVARARGGQARKTTLMLTVPEPPRPAPKK